MRNLKYIISEFPDPRPEGDAELRYWLDSGDLVWVNDFPHFSGLRLGDYHG
jgi:hypothetical protein